MGRFFQLYNGYNFQVEADLVVSELETPKPNGFVLKMIHVCNVWSPILWEINRITECTHYDK